MIGVHDAIRKYDLKQADRPGACAFGTFVYQVVTRRFKNYCNHWWRDEKHLDRSLLETAADGDDPVAEAIDDERAERLWACLNGLGRDARRFYVYLSFGLSERHLARLLGITTAALKHRKQKLMIELSHSVGGGEE